MKKTSLDSWVNLHIGFKARIQPDTQIYSLGRTG